MIKRGVFGILVVFLIGFVWAFDYGDIGSNTGTEFTTPGCSFNIGGTLVSSPPGECYDSSDRVLDGLFYCYEGLPDNQFMVTAGEDYLNHFRINFEVGPEGQLPESAPNLGCAMGDPDFDPDVDGRGCCPDDWVCTKIDDNEFQCRDPGNECSSDLGETTCEDDYNGIHFDFGDGNSYCVCPNIHVECQDYLSETVCNNNYFEASGQFGEEECAGGDFVCTDGALSFNFGRDEGECGCVWDAGECKGYFEARSALGGTDDRYSCTTSSDFGECDENGLQTYDFDAVFQIISGFGGTNPSEAIQDCLCPSGNGQRACGTPIVKLPFFSIFSLLFALIIIGAYFVIENKRGLIR